MTGRTPGLPGKRGEGGFLSGVEGVNPVESLHVESTPQEVGAA